MIIEAFLIGVIVGTFLWSMRIDWAIAKRNNITLQEAIELQIYLLKKDK